jgi:integrase
MVGAVRDEFRRRVDIQLPAKLLSIVTNGRDAERKERRHFLARHTLSEERQYLRLAPGELRIRQSDQPAVAEHTAIRLSRAKIRGATESAPGGVIVLTKIVEGCRKRLGIAGI